MTFAHVDCKTINMGRWWIMWAMPYQMFSVLIILCSGTTKSRCNDMHHLKRMTRSWDGVSQGKKIASWTSLGRKMVDGKGPQVISKVLNTWKFAFVSSTFGDHSYVISSCQRRYLVESRYTSCKIPSMLVQHKFKDSTKLLSHTNVWNFKKH